MHKDFDTWNTNKKSIHGVGEPKRYHVRDIWWCALGANIGTEQDGTGQNHDRPVVVMSGFDAQSCFVVALVGKKREGKYYFYLGKIGDRDATAKLSQAKVVDTRRFVRKIGVLEQSLFKQLQDVLKDILFPHP